MHQKLHRDIGVYAYDIYDGFRSFMLRIATVQSSQRNTSYKMILSLESRLLFPVQY